MTKKILSKLQRVYNKYFQIPISNKIKLEENFYSRHAFLNKALCKFNNPNYLEIGVADNSVFNSIPCKMINKFGVDPDRGGNFRMTSDVFFNKHSDIRFDVIFIDGSHQYLQCQKDCINSIKSLNKDGLVFLHDLLPKNHLEQLSSPSKKTNQWTGDVWKVAVELFNSKKCSFKIINIDHGIGVLKIEEGFEYKKMPELENSGYEKFLESYKFFSLINAEDALDYIEAI